MASRTILANCLATSPPRPLPAANLQFSNRNFQLLEPDLSR
jgi:hypothetical protein